jgi:hypothetical protein
MLVVVCAGYLLIVSPSSLHAYRPCRHVPEKASFPSRPDQAESCRKSAITLTSFDYLGNQIVLRCDVNRKIIEKNFVPSQLSFLEQAKRRIARRIRALWP